VNKLFAVLKREYLQAVRKKSFIIMTFLFPFLMTGLMFIPILAASKGMGKKNVAVLDGTGLLRDAFTRPNEQPPVAVDPQKEAREALQGKKRSGMNIPSQLNIQYVDKKGADVKAAASDYIPRLRTDKEGERLDGILIVPGEAMNSEEAELTYYSRSATDIMTQERLGRMTNKVIQRHRFTANGIDMETVERLTQDVPVSGVQISKSGEQKKGGEANILLAFVFALLLMLPSFIYGNEIMRGIVQEKSDRVVEILISSMKPMQLLSGKISGVAAVGLTQISVWIAMLAAVGIFFGTVAQSAGMNVTQFIRPMVFVYFFVFFVLAYLTYVCIYAIAGSVCNSEKEAQQLIAPITIVMMVPWFLMMPIIMNPDSNIAVGFSLAPVWGPMTMFVRTVVSEPPFWHIAVSILTSLATILVFFWLTGKIFRVGILSYGKRPTLPEIWRWLKVA
jgi:ABC-2 type transport system permease protein